MITRNEGRQGETTEYVEFRIGGKSTAFVAQKGSSGYWFVFQVEAGKHGTVKTLGSYKPRGKALAIKAALVAARVAEGRETT